MQHAAKLSGTMCEAVRAPHLASGAQEERLVVFVRSGQPPLRVRARPGPSASRVILCATCRITLWERTNGGIILELHRPFASGSEHQVIAADTISDAAKALERIGASGQHTVEASVRSGQPEDVVGSFRETIQQRTAARGFCALISDFLSHLGPEAEVAFPSPYPKGECS